MPEATTITEAALSIKDFHKNVAISARQLKEVAGEEQKKEEQVLAKAKRMSEFNRTFGAAIAKLTPDGVGQLWKDSNCVLEATWDKKTFRAVGSYEQPSLGALARAILGRDSAKEPPTRYLIVYHASVVGGRALIGTVTRSVEGQTPSAKSILGTEEKPKLLMVFTEDGLEIQILEQEKNSEPKFYSLRQALTK